MCKLLANNSKGRTRWCALVSASLASILCVMMAAAECTVVSAPSILLCNRFMRFMYISERAECSSITVEAGSSKPNLLELQPPFQLPLAATVLQPRCRTAASSTAVYFVSHSVAAFLLAHCDAWPQ